MSTVCHAFVQNAWRRDICSNCFRVRDEHSTTERDNDNSVKLNNNKSNNATTTAPAIIPRKSISKKYAIDGPSNGGDYENFSQKVNRFQGGYQSSAVPGLISNNNTSSYNNAILSSSTLSQFGQQGNNSVSPKISNTTVGNGKFSGTNDPTTGNCNLITATAKGVSGSKSNTSTCGISNNSHQHNDNSSTSHETNGKTWSSGEVTMLKSTLSSSHLHLNQPQAVMQQGKGVMMTNPHPSKSDNASVTSNQNNNDNIPTGKQFTSSSVPSGAVSHQSSTSTLGRNSGASQSSSYILSKNIFNNVHVTTTASNVGSSCMPHQSTSSTARSTTTSAIMNNCTSSTTGLAGCVNGSSFELNTTLISSALSSTGLSHPQSSDSIKRGNNSVSASSTSSSLLAPTTSVSSSETVISNSGCGGTIVDIVVSCNNGGVSGASHHSKNLENCDQTGMSKEISNFGEGSRTSSVSFSAGAARGVHSSTQSVLSKPRGVKQVHVETDSGGDSILDRRKVSISGVDCSSTHVNGCSAQVMSSNGILGKPVPAARTVTSCKGILRSKNGNKKREKNVRFPDEVVSVIGYGGGPSGLSDYEDDSPPDPLDSASVNEVMEKSSTSSEDKELHRLTQKNTNFNSIKTNLLGTTCIEIGPIVGCTGGKSMEGSSKPLVSIGTFETRKEPLRIRKKISEDSADDELNEKTVEIHRKFTSKSSAGSGHDGRPPLPTSQAPTKGSAPNSIQSSAAKVLSEQAKQQDTTVSSSKGVISSNLKTTSTTINSISSKTTVSGGKPANSNSTVGGSTTSSMLTQGNGSTTITVNPEKALANDSSKEKSSFADKSVKSKTSQIPCSSSSATSRVLQSSNITISSVASANKVNKWGSSSSSNITSSATDSSALRNNKPVLKRIHGKNLPETCETYTANTAIVEVNKSYSSSTMNDSAKSTTNGRSSNLIILTNGDKSTASGVSIASKRTSFLRDIVDSASGSGASSTMDGKPSGLESNNSTSAAASSEGVQVICSGNNGSVGPIATVEQDALLKSTLKVDLKPSVNNGKLSHPPFAECLSNRSNGTDDSSEFDDSLEDSGLDIKKCSEISESDEKSGSGSDSGNENDYSDRERVTMNPKQGLYISVEDVEGTRKKPEKLSPDSVLFSSVSEMSASGSSESIPEALDALNSQKTAEPTSQVDGGNLSKRTAPMPPSASNACPDAAPNMKNSLYANTHSTTISTEGLYDDVSFYRNPMHFPQEKDEKETCVPLEDENDEDENIYDDCAAIMDNNKVKATGKSVAGSYNFQSESALDSDGEEDVEKVVQRRPDGIEFIGIRKIDSESFLRERSPTPDRFPDGNRERSFSASPKTRRKVNQFFSTIGKKAGAAFSHHVQAYKNKSNPIIEDSVVEKSPSGDSSAYKRSMSTDEVSMARTQVYATLTPTSMKFKGLGPVLHKLSKIDINLNDKEKGACDEDEGKEKGSKKHKISSSIKKFLRFGSKDGMESGSKYDFGNCQAKTETSRMSAAQGSQDGLSDHSTSRTPSPTKAVQALSQLKLSTAKPYGTVAARPPPPPPPRVHSLDLLTRVGVVPNGGTVRPARPPPPTRQNRVAPSFTQVFTNPGIDLEAKTDALKQPLAHLHPENPDPNNPPSKPKRKASMNLDCVTNGASRDLETTYNHITTLNLETLKLIASQTPLKIRRSANLKRRASSHLKWSHFQIQDPCKSLTQGQGFAFYSALLDDESCVLLVQETTAAPNFSAPFEFPCVETSSTFEDSIPLSYVTWKASEYATNGSNVKVFVSVMPKFSMHTVENYMRHSQVPLLHKYFALLQAMSYWDKQDMSDLLVLVQSMDDLDNSSHSSGVTRGNSSDTACVPSSSPSSVLVYVHPIPHLSPSLGRSSSKTLLTTDFENAMKQLLLNNGTDGSTPLLGEHDRQVLLKRLSQNRTKTVQEQFRLFLQVKLFAPKRDSGEMERIKTLRTERAIQQWLDRERALCMKEAIEQTLQRNVESSISPYKRSYLEFLLTPENSAKAVLDMVMDLLE